MDFGCEVEMLLNNTCDTECDDEICGYDKEKCGAFQ